MNISDILLERYGPLLTLEQLATVLDRSPSGLRWSIHNQASMQDIKRTRVQIGKRVYFRSGEIAEILENKPATEAGGLARAY